MIVKNPFSKQRNPKRYEVAELVLSGNTVSWQEICKAVGKCSPRTMGYILRALEDQGATIHRLRDTEIGTMYKYDPTCEFEERYRLSKANGADARREAEKEDAAANPPAVYSYENEDGRGSPDTISMREML